MAKRILPYRDYSEHDVVNLFSLDLSSATATTLAGMVSNGSGGLATCAARSLLAQPSM